MSLVKKAVRGAAWTTVTSMAARVFSLVATLAVTHKIAPSEYGQASAAGMVALSVSVMSSLWLANYLIVDREAGRPGAWLANWVHQLSGVLALAAVLPFSDRIGALIGAPELGRYLPLAALAVLIDRLGVVPEKIIVRDLRFRHLALTRMAGEMSYGIVTFCAAWLGQGGMSLVYGMLARSVARSGAFVLVVPWREWCTPQPFDGQLARRMLDYGLPLWIGGLSTYISTNWDNLLVSRYFGPAVMATYSLAFNLTDMPAAQIGEQLSEVLLPSFALLTPEHRRTALAKALLVVSLVSFPVAAGLGAVSSTLVRAIFDPRWAGLAPMITVLSLRALSRTAFYPIIQYLQASNRTRMQMFLFTGYTALVLGVIVALGSSSPLSTCVGVVVCNQLLLVAGLLLIGRDGVAIGAIALGLLRIVAACAVMAGAVLGVRQLLSPYLVAPTLLLVVEIAVGGVVYPVAALLLCGPPARDLRSWISRGLGRASRAA